MLLLLLGSGEQLASRMRRPGPCISHSPGLPTRKSLCYFPLLPCFFVLAQSAVRVADLESRLSPSTGQMAAATESAPRNYITATEGPLSSMGVRTIPIITPTIKMSTPSPGEPMDITTPTGSSAPASATKSPDRDALNGGSADRRQPLTPQHEQQQQQPQSQSQPADNTMPAPSAAATAVHQPKVQTAFIHKLWR